MGPDLLPFPAEPLCCVCLVNRGSSSIFTLVELDFTWGQGVFDNVSLSPSYRSLNCTQCGPPEEASEGAFQTYPRIPPDPHLPSLALRHHTPSRDPGALDKHWQRRRGISVTDGYWLSDTVICFCAAAQLISHKEAGEMLLDYYSERWSVSLHWVPYLIHLSFALQNILFIFSNMAGWHGGVSRPPSDILYTGLNNDRSSGLSTGSPLFSTAATASSPLSACCCLYSSAAPLSHRKISYIPEKYESTSFGRWFLWNAPQYSPQTSCL